MDIKSVVYSEELNRILHLAENRAKKNNLAEVSLESVQYFILNTYLEGKGEGKALSRLIDEKIEKEQREPFMKEVEEALARSEKYVARKTYSEDECDQDNPDFGDSLKRVIERVGITFDIIEGSGRADKPEAIDTETFYTAMFFERTDINLILMKNKIDNATLLENILEVKEEDKEEKVDDLPEDKKEGKDSEEENFEAAGKRDEAVHVRKPKKNSNTPTLDEFGVDMTENAEDGKYDPVIGRDKEITQMIEILCCRKKKNVMILGPAGTGKSALVEGLAQKIVAGNVPRPLKGKRIVSISTTDLIAGTQYRGQLEERVMNLCNELKEQPDVIIYIDEVHTAQNDSSSSISDLLKPSLARGEITLIASTTLDEFKKYLEKDGAFKRRFQRIILSEPNREETFKILKGLVKKYSDYHKVRYTDEVLRACAEYSEKYMYDRKSPDRAIDIMDTAGAETKLANPSDTEELDRLEKAKEEAIKKKRKAIDKSDFSDAKFQREEEIRLDKEIEVLKKRAASADPKTWPEVTIETVASVISRISGVDVDKIVTPEMDKIRAMAADLKKIIIGQDEAIDETVKALSKSFLGLRNENRPIGSFLLTGPSGVGKSLLAEKIAETIFGTKDALIRIDGGEYRGEGSITKLIGASASFVGYNDSAVLEKVRDRQQCLLMIDECEKMESSVLNSLFLNILDTGHCQLANGKDVNFRNSLILLTSNQGTKELELKGNGIGFGDPSKESKKASDRATVMKSLKNAFRPEFLGRLNKVIIFNSLGEPEMMKIFDLELAKFKERLKKKGYSITVGKELKKYIVSKVDTRFGARDLIKGIGTYIEDKVVEKLLEPTTDLTKKKIKANLVGEEVEITVE